VSRRILLPLLLLVGRTLPASAQPVTPEILHGGVPTGDRSSTVLELTLDGAIERGLHHNLGLILGQERVREAEGEHGEARSDLLPHLRAGAYAVRQKLSLAAFGFTDFGDFPELIGPFDVVDARGYVSQTVLDLHAIRHAQSEGLNAKAAGEQQRSTRDAWCWRAPASTCRRWRARAASTRRRRSSRPPRRSSTSPPTASRPASRPASTCCARRSCSRRSGSG
jgi:hypothetical protein